MKPRRARDRLIVALDCADSSRAVAMARQLRGVVRTLKVGSALFTACGPHIVRRLRALGFQVMLDLKFFDIPSTVERSCRAAVRQRVSMVTVHAQGAAPMLRAAVRGVRAEARRRRAIRPLVLGVTALTSLGDGVSRRAMTATVLRLAREAIQAGCDGVVASAHEVLALRKRFGRQPWIVCPGIRPAQARVNDQRRVAEPSQALAQGADALVVGRPITAARRPRQAAQRILEEMEAQDAC